MASASGRSPRDLSAELRADGPAFRFFQAVRLLALSMEQGEARAAVPPGVRFTTPLSLEFPASEIQGMTPVAGEEDGEPERLEMTVGFLGMTGPSGVLPTAYTELLIERRHQYRDTTAHDFLDLFSHRALSLFYQAWRKHRFYLPFETGEQDRFARNLLDLVGVGLRSLQERMQKHGQGLPDRFLIHYAGLLAQKPASAENIAALVRGYFGAPAEVEQYVGQWMLVPTAEQSRLGRESCVLGETAFLGERMWDRQTKIRIRIGPLRKAQFDALLPGGSGMAALRELVQFCVGHTLAADAQPVLHQDDIPEPRLEAHTLRLGYNIWLNDGPAARHADQIQYTLLN